MPMPKKYLLVDEPTGMAAEALGSHVGMRAVQTHLGTLLEEPEPFDFERQLATINRVLNPPPKRDPRCTCGPVMVGANCPVHPIS